MRRTLDVATKKCSCRPNHQTCSDELSKWPYCRKRRENILWISAFSIFCKSYTSIELLTLLAKEMLLSTKPPNMLRRILKHAQTISQNGHILENGASASYEFPHSDFFIFCKRRFSSKMPPTKSTTPGTPKDAVFLHFVKSMNFQRSLRHRSIWSKERFESCVKM